MIRPLYFLKFGVMLMKTHNSSITIQEEFVQKIQDDNRKEKLMQLAPLLVLVGLIVVFAASAEPHLSALATLSI